LSVLLRHHPDPRNVLEIGAGECSTPFLHRAAVSRGFRLWTAEDTPEWMAFAIDIAGRSGDADQRHVVTHSGWLNRFWLAEQIRWSIAFVDGPAHDRAPSIRWLASRAEIVVVHDTEPRSNLSYGWGQTLMAPQRIDVTCPFYGIRTSVLSRDKITDPMSRDLLKLDRESNCLGEVAREIW
jgi:hypothetical protein